MFLFAFRDLYCSFHQHNEATAVFLRERPPGKALCSTETTSTDLPILPKGPKEDKERGKRQRTGL